MTDRCDTPRPDGLRGLPRPDPLVRRQGPAVRGDRRTHASASVPGGPPLVVIDLVELTYADVGPTPARAPPSSTRSRWPSTSTPRPGSTTPSSAGGRTPSTAGCTPTTRCTTARRWRCGSAAFDRPRASGETRRRAEVPPAAGPRPRPGGALDAVLRRAVQLLGRLRRGRADEGVPQGHPGRQPRHHRPRGAHPRPGRSTSPRSTAGWRPRDPAGPDGGVLQLAMLQQFLRTASDGWELALASVRNLFADAEDSADAECTPTRSAATSPPRRPGSARRSARCTRCCTTTSRPRPAPRRRPRSWPRR